MKKQRQIILNDRLWDYLETQSSFYGVTKSAVASIIIDAHKVRTDATRSAVTNELKKELK